MTKTTVQDPISPDLKQVLQLRNLRKLNLNYTDLTADGIRQLRGRKKLQELALSGTKVSFAVARELAGLPELKALYIWNTGMDSASIARLREAREGLRVETGYRDDGRTILPLTPPVAKTVPGIYQPSTPIELKHPYRGVQIRYTLDGTEPDSLRSPV